MAISRKGRLTCSHEHIPLPCGISPLRSDYRPHPGRNDIIKPVVHNVISSVSQEVSLREKRNFTHSRQPTRQRGLRAEKSPAEKTARNIYAPAYPPAVAHRRTRPFKYLPAGAPCRQPTCPRGLRAPRRFTAAKKEADGKSASYVKRYIVYAVNPNRKS